MTLYLSNCIALAFMTGFLIFQKKIRPLRGIWVKKENNQIKKIKKINQIRLVSEAAEGEPVSLAAVVEHVAVATEEVHVPAIGSAVL
jgi:hypothetical protein